MARSGCRARSARVSRVRRVANTKASASAPPTAACRNCRNARVYGLHRRRDVAQDDERSRLARAPSHDPARGVAPGPVARAQRRADVEPVAPAVSPRPARDAQRRRQRQLAHEPAQRQQLLGVELGEVPVAEALVGAGRRDRRVALGVVALGALAQPGLRHRPAGRRPAERRGVRRRPPFARLGAPHRRGVRIAARAGGIVDAVEDVGEDRVEAVDLVAVGDEHGARRPVEAVPIGRRRERDRTCEARRVVGRRGHAGVVQRAPERARHGGQVEDELRHRASPRAARGRGRASPAGPRGT